MLDMRRCARVQYGTVPVVASTGGLVDTVKDGVTGFQMGAFDPDAATDADTDAIAAAMARAAEAYATPKVREVQRLFLLRICSVPGVEVGGG